MKRCHGCFLTHGLVSVGSSPSAGLRSSFAASDCSRDPLHPYLPGLYSRAAGPAPAGETGEAIQQFWFSLVSLFTWILLWSHSGARAFLTAGFLIFVMVFRPLCPTDFCNPVAVILVYSVCPAQVHQCGQAGCQCHGDPPHRWSFLLYVWNL